MNILIVEPSASYRRAVNELLSSHDVDIIESSSGKEALAYLQQNRPDAITLSHEMGDMNSFEFLEALHSHEHLQNIPKFLITSNISKAFKRQAYDAGFTEIFVKSDFQVLKRAMQSLLLYATVQISARVLYIEDTQSTADYTRYVMETVGWQVEHVKSGEEAIAILEKDASYDLVVTDLVLEGKISGIGVIHLIRQGREALRQMPILAVSGWNDLLRQVYVLKHGAGDFIAKPFHETDFLARAINLILTKRKLDDSLASQKALYNKAHLDVVSGLNNRHHFEEYGDQLIRDSLKQGEPVSMCVIDIDHFKKINDQRGHSFGDEVIAQLGELVLSVCCSPDDLTARYGGDEVVMVLPECDYASLLSRTEQLRQGVAEFLTDENEVTVTIGAFHLADQTELDKRSLPATAKSLFALADDSLYIAKKAGRNRVCINQELIES